MSRSKGIFTSLFVVLVALALALPLSQAADISKDLAVKYILATAKAARTVFVKDIIASAKKGGVKPAEDWQKSDHAIMLPAQFVKSLGENIDDFELGLVGTHPLYPSNKAKTKAEEEALKKLASGKAKVVTFEDGGQFKGMSADFAIVQGCADCHNKHPKTTKKDWKKGDFMGAVVVRLKS